MKCPIPTCTVFLGFLLTAGALVGPAVLAQTSPPNESANAEVAVAGRAQLVHLPNGTAVRVRTTKDISSGKSKKYEELRFRVASDVLVGDLVVIRRGAEAVGRVASVKKNGMMGRAGRLAIEVTSVEAVTGKAVALRSDQKLSGEGRGVDILGASLQTYGLGAPVFIWFRGDNVKIEAGSTLTAFVDGNVALDDAALRTSQPPPKAATGLATVFVLRSEKHGEKNPTLYCGSVAIGQLHGRHFIEVRLPPGDYLLQSPGIETPVQLRAAADQTYYVQFRPNSFRASGRIQLMHPLQGDDLLAFPWWAAEPKVDLSGADPARLRDTKGLPKPGGEKEPAE